MAYYEIQKTTAPITMDSKWEHVIGSEDIEILLGNFTSALNADLYDLDKIKFRATCEGRYL